MSVIVLQGLALLLQILAAILALRLIKVTGKSAAWILLALAFVLVVARRGIAYANLFSVDPSLLVTPNTALDSYLLLSISLCQLAGIYLIGPIFQAISQSKQAITQLNVDLRLRHRALILITQVNQILVRAPEESRLIQDVCHTIVEMGGYRLVWVGIAEGDAAKTIRPVAAAGVDADYLSVTHFSWAEENPWGRGPAGIAIRTGQPVVVHDIRTDALFTQWRDEAVARGYIAAVALPLCTEEKTLGVLALYQDHPDAFTGEEVTLLMEMAGDLAYGMVALRTREAHRRAEEALREQREFLRTVIDTVPNFIGVKDTEGRYILVNRALADAYGVTPEEVIGKTDADFNPNPEEVAWFQRDDREVISTCTPKYIPEEKITDAQGHVRWLSTTKVPLLDADGTCSRVLLTTHDITERKRALDAIKRESAFLSSAIELLPFPILFVAPNREIIRQNSASLTLLREPGNYMWVKIQLQHPQTRVPIAPEEWPLARALRGETMPPTDLLMVLSDGREVPILLQGAPIYVDHALVAAVVAIQDITTLKVADQAKNQFISVLSHELKTPLTTIIGWTQLAESAPDLIPEALQTIHRNAQAYRMMLDRLLILSRILSGRLDVRPQRIDLWQTTTAALDAVRSQAQAHGVTLEVHAPSGPLPVDADPALIRRVIDEVLDNALKFTPTGGAITLTGTQQDGTAMLIVRDTGRGFAPEQQVLLLHPFQQLQRMEEYGGIGIGLALVKGIIETHGGQVHITSPGIGQGSTVTLTLPLAA